MKINLDSKNVQTHLFVIFVFDRDQSAKFESRKYNVFLSLYDVTSLLQLKKKDNTQLSNFHHSDEKFRK